MIPIVFFINVNGIKIYFLFFIYIVITIVMISKQLFIYLFLCLHHQNYHYCYNSIHFFVYFLSFIFFLIECQATCFKNSSYIFSKSGRGWYDNRNVCLKQGFDLVSIETEKKSGTYVSKKKKMMTLKLSFFCIACS